MKFVASEAGWIAGLEYYRGTGDLGTHTGSLWSSTGQLLATATFAAETASGWQTVYFSESGDNYPQHHVCRELS